MAIMTTVISSLSLIVAFKSRHTNVSELRKYEAKSPAFLVQGVPINVIMCAICI
jgi:hypothetical protein